MQNLYGMVFRYAIFTGMLLAAVTAQAEWLLHESASGCVLETDEITWPDGYQDTSVRLNINEKRLLVLTDSNVDTSFDDTALQVDGHTMMTTVSLVDEQNLRFDTGMPALIQQFRKGNRVRIYMRFWPSYPATERFEIPFSLAGFTRSWNDYMACVEKNSG